MADEQQLHLTDQREIEKRLTHKAAHRARQAHRVIRLREVGFDGDLQTLAHLDVGGVGAAGSVGPGGLGRLVNSTLAGADKDLPGATDLAFSKRLFGLDREELFSEWKTNADEAAHDFDADGHSAAAASEEQDRRAAEEADARTSEQGEWGRSPFNPHGLLGPWAANALYDLGREGFLAAEIDWDTAVIKVDLVDTGAYTIDLATHKFRSSIAVGARIASSAALGSKTVSAGVADAADITYTALTGTSIELIVIYQSSAVTGGADVADTAQRLIAAIDTATGLPFTPSGGDVTVTWDNTTNRIFKL